MNNFEQMDTLNQQYPLYRQNRETARLSDEERAERDDMITLAEFRKKRKPLLFDDFCTIHSDDLWYLWCMISGYRDDIGTCILKKMTYAKFCIICFKNSS